MVYYEVQNTTEETLDCLASEVIFQGRMNNKFTCKILRISVLIFQTLSNVKEKSEETHWLTLPLSHFFRTCWRHQINQRHQRMSVYLQKTIKVAV